MLIWYNEDTLKQGVGQWLSGCSVEYRSQVTQWILDFWLRKGFLISFHSVEFGLLAFRLFSVEYFRLLSEVQPSGCSVWLAQEPPGSGSEGGRLSGRPVGGGGRQGRGGGRRAQWITMLC